MFGTGAMSQRTSKKEALLEELISKAKSIGIEVRKEKLLREIGYRARSGRCRFKDKELIILDRDAPLGEQVDFLAGEINERKLESFSPLQSRGQTRPSPPSGS